MKPEIRISIFGFRIFKGDTGLLSVFSTQQVEATINPGTLSIFAFDGETTNADHV